MKLIQILFSFQGQIPRKTYILATLANILITLSTMVGLLFIWTFDASELVNFLWFWLIVLLSAWIANALNFKRCRDMGDRFLWAWLALVGYFLFIPIWVVAVGMMAFSTTESDVIDPEIF